MVVLPEDSAEAALETPAAVFDELAELEDPPEAQPDSNATIITASTGLIAPDLAKIRRIRLPLFDMCLGPRA